MPDPKNIHRSTLLALVLIVFFAVLAPVLGLAGWPLFAFGPWLVLAVLALAVFIVFVLARFFRPR